MKIRLAILAAILTSAFSVIGTTAKDKTPPKKEVIPHAQDHPPGPPLSPQEAIKKMQVPPGFHVELVAAEPDIVNPVAMTFDERGRIWITESIEYPRRSAGPGKDRVKLLESTKGDGKFDKITTVITGLNIPSGIAIGHGGVWIANSPDILFYPIEDFAKAKLGKPQVVVTGFGRDDTHELPNSLTWGPDGWLYGLNGVFNRSVIKQDGKTFDFTCALFRIHPKTKKFEIFCEGTSNPWGLAFNENGDAFVSACVIDHLWHLTETGYYQRQGGPYPPFTWPIGSIVKHHHQKAAYCGLCWFDSDAYPPEYREKMYMGNIHGGCINCDQLERDGSTYFAKPGLLPEKKKNAALPLPSPPVLRGRGPGGEGDALARTSLSIGFPVKTAFPGASAPSPLTPLPRSTGGEGKKAQGVGPGGDFLVANDAWFMPVAQKVGPDGCMYILDWYDRYHCYQDANRDPAGIDRLRGRLYRVVYKDYKATGKFDLGEEMDDDLIKRYHHPNVLFRETAQRLLNEHWISPKGQRNVFGLIATASGLRELADDEKIALKARLYAAYTAGAENNIETLNTKNSVLRAAWVRVNLNRGNPSPEISDKIAAMAKDPSPEVQLQVAIAARKLKGVDAMPVLLDVLAHCGDDKLIPHIVWQNLHPLLEKDGDRFLTLAAKVDLAKSPGLAKVLPRAIDRILGNPKGDPAVVIGFLKQRATKDKADDTAALILNALAAKIQIGEINGPGLAKFKASAVPVLQKFLAIPKTRVAATLLAATLGEDTIGKFETRLDAISLLEGGPLDAQSPNPSESLRLQALDALMTPGWADPAIRRRLRDASTDMPAFRGKVITKLSKLSEPWVAETVLANYTNFNDDEKAKAIELLTQRPTWAKSLFKEIAAKKISKDAVNVNQARRLLGSKDAELVKLVEKYWGTARDSRNPNGERVVAQMRELFKKTPGDPKAGVPVFKKLCAQCHKIYGEGVEVGPDLTSNGRSDFDQLLSNIFDPSLVIGAGYHAVTVTTKQGQTISGLIVEDNAQRVILKVQGGERKTIARKDVDEQNTSKVSLMPEDLEKQLRPQEIVDLLSYLSLDRPPGDPNAKRIRGTPR